MSSTDTTSASLPPKPAATTPAATPAPTATPTVKTQKRDMFDLAVKVDSLVSGETMVTIEPPLKGKRVPVDICCVVDISGSMGAEATLKNAEGSTESHGLSVLDVAKHSVQTIIQMLGSEDRLSLVTYSTTADVVMSLSVMNTAGKTKAKATVDKMQTQSSTNIWAGLMKGLKDLKDKLVLGKQRYQCILLLTDGQPNISPPAGEVAMLQNFQDKNPNMKCVVHTFGFGYNLNTVLLQQLAEVGGGAFSFIPDASLVGTVFVNAASNILVTQGYHAQLRLTPLNGANFVDGPLLSGLPKGMRTTRDEKKKDVVTVNVGAVHFGQRTQVLFNMKFGAKGKPHLKAELIYVPAIRAKYNDCRIASAEAVRVVPADKEITAQIARYLSVDCISGILTRMNMATADDVLKLSSKILVTAVDKIRKLPHGVATSDARVADTVKDLLGQVKEAIGSKDAFNRWGRHYLPSLAQAHLQQCCNNFKDPGVQHYGGKDFFEQRDIADEIFCKMPPPKPTKPVYNHHSAHTPAKPVATMQTYYNAGGGCFHGNCSITMADGTTKPLREVRRGEKVLAGAGQVGTVWCVTRTPATNGKMKLVRLPNTQLMATPYHPVKVAGKWQFPCDLGQTDVVPCDAVFNLLLKDGASMVIEGVECVALGHGLTGDVVGHRYFGNRQKVTRDLQNMAGWGKGLVNLSGTDLVRDPKTNLVVGMQHGGSRVCKQPQQLLQEQQHGSLTLALY